MIAASRTLAEGAAPGVERPVQLSAESLWTDISAHLKETLSDGPFAQWFSGARGKLDDGVCGPAASDGDGAGTRPPLGLEVQGAEVVAAP